MTESLDLIEDYNDGLGELFKIWYNEYIKDLPEGSIYYVSADEFVHNLILDYVDNNHSGKYDYYYILRFLEDTFKRSKHYKQNDLVVFYGVINENKDIMIDLTRLEDLNNYKKILDKIYITHPTVLKHYLEHNTYCQTGGYANLTSSSQLN